MLIRIPKIWDVPDAQVTPEVMYLDRRRFLAGLGGTIAAATMGGALLQLAGCKAGPVTLPSLPPVDPNLVTKNPLFLDAGRPLTNELLASQYNNFYEFGGNKSIYDAAQALPLENWTVEVAGLVNKPQTFAFEDLKKKFPLEERVYRHRCVEAWAMTVPWLGFPMNLLLKEVDPKAEARFVRFTSYYNPKITTGPFFTIKNLPWPYQESLRIDEMANDLAFFAVGIYGHDMPKQHGAPLRMVTPWKYGFKGAKSVVKIEFLDAQPPTFWNTLVPTEYDYEANVNPLKPHPRWSQATERLIGDGGDQQWQTVDTKPFNGYGEYVAKLY